MVYIQTNSAPIPAGHYSQAIIANGFIFLAGQLPIIPGLPNRQMPEGMAAQAHQVFTNIQSVLQAAGASLNDLVNVQIFIPHIDQWSEVNGVYQQHLGAHKPARTVIPCGPLHYGALIEVNAVAVVSNKAD